MFVFNLASDNGRRLVDVGMGTPRNYKPAWDTTNLFAHFVPFSCPFFAGNELRIIGFHLPKAQKHDTARRWL